ncbi:universal stress protein [Pseudomonas fluorescens]|uniref:Universal stress protein E n=1 Tax=Pseudomonas fluorescens TaxID=294 RepID=A0A5E7FG08_PSEFL|nr:universal stress protein [Pseudomonas fluorescens]VVO38116.1 Universal stress protein E [Pseudomonas fluorescens]
MSQYLRLFLIAAPTMRHSPAMERAVAIAEATDAALHIAVFIEDFDLMRLMSDSKQQRETSRQENEQWLMDEAGVLRHKGLEVTTEVLVTRDPLQEILQHVNQMRPDLVIKDLHHESALKGAVMTPLDWQLLRHCPAAVHLVSEVRCPLPRVVVAAVDPAHPAGQIHGINDSIIQAAQDLAEQCDAELHLLHAYDLSHTQIADAGAGAVTMPGFGSDVRRSLEKTFAVLARQYDVPVERQHFIAGPLTKALANFVAHSRADVIVMGNVHHKGLGKLIGSTTEHVLQHVRCNVLAIEGESINKQDG